MKGDETADPDVAQQDSEQTFGRLVAKANWSPFPTAASPGQGAG
jgi:hypothetical protein